MPDTATILRYACPLAAAAAAIAWPSVPAARKRRWASALLLAFSVLGGTWLYTAQHRATHRYFNAYEHYHYALPTRYAAELGYTGLYDATIAALLEDGKLPTLPKKLRDLETGKLVRAEVLIERAPATKARFSPERWESWRKDVRWFAGRLGTATLLLVLQDKGYNASPVYGAVAGAFTSRLEPGTPGFMALPYLDLTILVVTLGAIAWVFGVRTAAFVLAMLVTYVVTSHTHQKAALLRLDWICALLLSLCALKRGRFALGGVFTAYAAAIRVFPALFGFAMLVKLVDTAVRQRRLAKGPAVFLGAATATGLGAIALTLPQVGIEGWRAFFEKILTHNAQMTGWRVGLKYVLLGTWDAQAWGGKVPAVASAELWPLWYVVVAVSLAVAALVMRRLDDVEAHAFGFVVAFVLIAPTYYYWILVLIPTLALAARVESRPHAIGLALLFVGGAVGHAALDRLDRGWPSFYIIAVTIFVFVVWWTVSSLRPRGDAVRAEPPAPASQKTAPSWPVATGAA
jgi:hypothetical protein